MVVGYGKRIRDSYAASRSKTKKSYKCPNCSRVAVRRISTGIWKCKKCSVKFASGSYEFKV